MALFLSHSSLTANRLEFELFGDLSVFPFRCEGIDDFRLVNLLRVKGGTIFQPRIEQGEFSHENGFRPVSALKWPVYQRSLNEVSSRYSQSLLLIPSTGRDDRSGDAIDDSWVASKVVNPLLQIGPIADRSVKLIDLYDRGGFPTPNTVRRASRRSVLSLGRAYHVGM